MKSVFLESLAELSDLTRIEISGKCGFILSQTRGLRKHEFEKILQYYITAQS